MTSPEGLLLTLMNPPPGGEDEFNDWVDLEHIPERLEVPGFQTALRFANTVKSPRYLAIYDLDDIEVLNSEPYRSISGQNLSPWSKRVLAGTSDHWRFAGSRILLTGEGFRTGSGEFASGQLLLVTWRNIADESDRAIVRVLKDAFADSSPSVRYRLFRGETAGRFDYVCIGETTGLDFSDLPTVEQFSSGSLRSELVQSFTPLKAQ